MTSRLRPLVAALALAALLPLAPSCSDGSTAPAARPEPVAGGRLVVGVPGDVDAWNEYLSRQAPTRTVLRRIWPPLAERGPGDAFVPRLAESWSFSDDGLALTVRLAERVWSDGRPVTADDVRFTWEAQTSDDVPWVGAGSKRRIVSVDAVDPRTVVFRFDGVYPFRLHDAFEGGILPRHVHGEVPFDRWATHDWTTEAGVGSGPFLLDRHRPAESYVLVRNALAPDAEAPLLDEVVVRVIPDATALVTELRTGGIDYAERVPPRDAAALADDAAFGVVAYETGDVTSIGWNATRPPLDDPAVRTALTLAIDREALVEELLYGYGRVAALPVAEALGAERAVTPLPHDPARARGLLSAAGLAVRGPDGTLADGPRLEIELLTNAGNAVRQDALVKIQHQLEAVGVEASIGAIEMRALGGRVVGGDYDGYLLGTVAEARDLQSMVGSANVPPAGANYVRWSTPDVDAALERLAAARTQADAAAVFADLATLIHRGQPMTHLFVSQRLAAYAEHVHGVAPGPPTDPWARLHEWWVAAP